MPVLNLCVNGSQVLLELQQNLRSQEMRQVFALLELANRVQWDYTVAPRDLVEKWKQRGAKQGDATIAAYLEAANIPYLISENRDFLVELSDLPFTVLISQEALHALG